MKELIDPFLLTRFILLVNKHYNFNNDLGYITEYIEVLNNLYIDFLSTYESLLHIDEQSCIEHFVISEHCIAFMKDHLHLELDYVK